MFVAMDFVLRRQASAEDEQRLADLVEKEIVGRNLLGMFGPLLVGGSDGVRDEVFLSSPYDTCVHIGNSLSKNWSARDGIEEE